MKGIDMFGREKQFATVVGFAVRVKDERESDRNHIIESTFEIPLNHDLADEILPAMANDLFQETGGEWTAKPEIQQAEFNIDPDTQIMTIRTHPETDPVVRISGVTIRKVRAKKTEANTWVLVFTAGWQLADPKEAVVMIQQLKAGIYLTLVMQQPELPDVAEQPDTENQAE